VNVTKKNGSRVITLLQQERKNLASVAELLEDLARYPEECKTAAAALEALKPIVTAFQVEAQKAKPAK
jgi:N-acetyl-anhydromuramyl-L-alanine amidase AmpD